MAQSFEWNFEEFINKLEAFSLSSQFNSKDSLTSDIDSTKISLKMIQEFLSKERNTTTLTMSAMMSPRSSFAASHQHAVKKPQIIPNRPLPS